MEKRSDTPASTESGKNDTDTNFQAGRGLFEKISKVRSSESLYLLEL